MRHLLKNKGSCGAYPTSSSSHIADDDRGKQLKSSHRVRDIIADTALSSLRCTRVRYCPSVYVKDRSLIPTLYCGSPGRPNPELYAIYGDRDRVRTDYPEENAGPPCKASPERWVR
jgi:hypothetical protein